MLTDWLVRTFVANPEDHSNARTRSAFGALEGWASVVVNLVVFAVKLVPGLIIGSVSLVADAFHSLGDVASSLVVILGFRVAAKPSDDRHPFGHGRVESVASLLIAVMLFITAWEFGRASVDRLLHPKAVQASAWLIAVLVLTALLKEWLSRFSRTLGQRIGSTALIGDFWHHRSDVIATGIVILALLAANAGLWWVDGVGGLVVSAIIAWAAWQLLRDSVNPLIGEAPSPQVLGEIRDVALAVAGVDGVHDLIVHRYGELVVTSVHVEVSSAIDIERGHEIAEEVEKRLNRRFSGWSVVHVDPVNREHPLYAEVQTYLDETLPAIPGVEEFHDLRIVGSDETPFVIFDLKVASDDAGGVVDRVREVVAARFPTAAKVGINVEPRYVY